jgi:predicted nucleic acid-binding protein
MAGEFGYSGRREEEICRLRWTDNDPRTRTGLVPRDEWGRLVARHETAGRTIQAMDALIAATAQVHGLTLVTRNGRSRRDRETRGLVGVPGRLERLRSDRAPSRKPFPELSRPQRDGRP